MPVAGNELEFKQRTDGMGGMALRAAAPSVVVFSAYLMTFPKGLEIIRTATFWHRFLGDPRIYVMLVAFIWLIVWARLRVRYERLYVGRDALRYVSPYGGSFRFLSRLQPDWSLEWAKVKKAELQVQSLGLGGRRYRLVFQTDSKPRELQWPQSWQQIPVASGVQVALPRRDEAAMRRVIMGSSLVQALRARGVEVAEHPGLVRPQGALKGYDIGQDKRLMVAVGILLAGLIYWLGDTFIVWPYMAIENVPVWPYALAGSLGLWLGYDLGRNAPRMERTLISILLAGSLCAACYPLMLRFNAITAGSGQQLFKYTQKSAGYFKPPEASLPWIYFDTQTYWSVFPNGSTHEFRVLKGALGFYEVDTGRVQDEIHAWWATNKFP